MASHPLLGDRWFVRVYVCVCVFVVSVGSGLVEQNAHGTSLSNISSMR